MTTVKFPHFNTVLCIILFSLALVTCKKIDNSANGGGGTINPVTESLPDLTTKVTVVAVSGFVTDENDAAVQNAAVEVGGTIINTDKYGYFETHNALVVQNAATVTINKTGYFKTVKTFIAAAGKSAFFRVKLLPKTPAGTFSAASGGTVSLSSGMAVTLPAGAVVNAASGATYTGLVTVAAQQLSATDVNTSRTMPGDLRGLNNSGYMRVLTTYGMMAVELTGTSGELLQVASGKKATITMPVPSTLQASAPATIPLWYFDESKGLWKEEGTAAKTGTNYVGEVSHFSFWNYDIGNALVYFSCRVVNNAGTPVPNAEVRISAIAGALGYSGSGYTDADGYTGGGIPAGAELLLEVFSNSSCGAASYSKRFTSGGQPIALGDLVISASTAIATVSGTVTTCSNGPVTNGFVVVQNGSVLNRYALNSSGAYSFNMLLCGNTPVSATITAEDISNTQQGASIVQTINAGVNTIPNIQACVPAEQFLNYTINGTPYSYATPTDGFTTMGGPLSNLYWLNVNNVQELDFIRTGMAQGTQQDLFKFYCPQIPYDPNFVTAAPIKVNITEYGPVGYYISGNFSGIIIAPPASSQYNISCSFRFKRPY